VIRLALIGLVIGLVGCASKPRAPEAVAAPDSLRHPPAGDVIGTKGLYGGHVWRGIRYATAPIGENRFRAPKPAASQPGRFDATTFGSSCPQYASPLGGDLSAKPGSLVGQEDCLFLNVYAPEPGTETPGRVFDPAKSDLPVMFWIHGGGNTSGTASFYDGSRLAAEKNVIVVTVNYRLGFLGWFRHQSLREDASPEDSSGNFGTLDLILALDWVQANISAFGGDPSNVTIFGESAGGWNVISLLASPLAAGKFHRAIGQSSVTWSDSIARAENYVDDDPAGAAASSGETLIRLLIADKLATDRADAKKVIGSMDAAALARYLRGQPLDDLFAAYRREGSEADDGYVCPRVFEDGIVLPITPLALAFHGDAPFNRVPVMLGTNKDEEKLFLFYNPEYTKQLFGFIPRVRHRARYLRDAQTITRIWRMMGVDQVADDLVQSMPGQVFAYRFDWDEEPTLLGANLAEMLGAAHGFEIPFVFGHWNLGPASDRLFNADNQPGREGLSKAMRSYWAEFAATGVPGTGGPETSLPKWPAWTEGVAHFAIFDTEGAGGIRMTRGRETADDIAQNIIVDESYHSLEHRCRALASLYQWAPQAFTRRDYETIGFGLCEEYPIDGTDESF
jgi:para-nitrobenzyl esterase